MKKRRKARNNALEILYQKEISGLNQEIILKNREEADLEEIDEYCNLLIRGIEKHKKELDGLINKYAKNWRLDRMPIVDRNILKISIFELKHLKEVPVSVAINEAVEMAKIYGTENSSRFINGILGQVARDMEENGPKDGQPLAEKSILGKGKQGE
ncbi:MAG: transcription antitermination factor NusB, partial [Actinomycetia bacterium]|nr:transcription antitermination factor NusB [Actinomycetes bacterium]